MTVSDFQKANKLKREGKLEEAIAFYSKVIAQNPNFHWSYFYLGEILAELGSWEKAIANYQKAIELNSDFSRAFCSLGEVLAKVGRWEEAIANYKKAIEQNPNSYECHYHLGESLVQLGLWEEALGCYAKAIQQNPDFDECHYKLWEALVKVGRTQEAIAGYKEAIVAKAELVSGYQRLLKFQPNNWELVWQLGQILDEKSRSKEAIALYQKVIQLNPEFVEVYQSLLKLESSNWELWWQLGQIYQQQNNLPEAIAAYQKVREINGEFVDAYQKLVEIEPNNWEWWWQLGQIYQQQNQIPEAIGAYQKVIEINPEFISAYQYLVRIEPNDWKLWWPLGNVCLEQGHINAAIAAYQRVIDLNPGFAEASQKLEKIRSEQLENIHSESPQAPEEELLLRGEQLRCNNELEEAIECYKKLIEMSPNCLQGYLQLANVEAMSSKKSDALRTYHQLKKMKFAKLRSQGKIGIIAFCLLIRSASTYIRSELARGLKLNLISNLEDLIKDDLVQLDLDITRWNSGILANHFAAYPRNLILFNILVDRLVVHVRDPRQVLLSEVYNNIILHKKIVNTSNFLLKNQLDLCRVLIDHNLILFPESYFSWSFSDKIDWNLDNLYMGKITWINQWLDAEENSSFYPKIMFTKQEDLATNPQKFWDSILEFYEIEKTQFTYPEPPNFSENSHNRKGSTDEWREVLTPKQIEKASSMIPKRILERFGWPEK